MVKIKHKDFIGAAPVMPCQNSSWVMGLRIYGEGRTAIPLSSPATIGPLARMQDRQGLYWYKKLLIIAGLVTLWYPSLIIIMLFLLANSPLKLKLGKIHAIIYSAIFWCGNSKSSFNAIQDGGRGKKTPLPVFPL